MSEKRCAIIFNKANVNMIGYLNCSRYTWGAGLGDTSWLQVSVSIHQIASQINNDDRNSVHSLGCRYIQTLQLDVGEECGYGSVEGDNLNFIKMSML